MTKKELEIALDEVLENYRHEMQSQFDDYSKEPATKGDLAELSRQMFYVMNSFKGNLMMYLQ